MTYNRLVELLEQVFKEMPEGVDLAKGGVGELALAHHLGHSLVKGDKGADGRDEGGDLYEYKISTTDQFNFHFGARNDNFANTVTKHFENLVGAYCAKREGMEITEVEFVPSEILVPALIEHFEKTKGGQLNKNFRLNSFKALNNS